MRYISESANVQNCSNFSFKHSMLRVFNEIPLRYCLSHTKDKIYFNNCVVEKQCWILPWRFGVELKYCLERIRRFVPGRHFNVAIPKIVSEYNSLIILTDICKNRSSRVSQDELILSEETKDKCTFNPLVYQEFLQLIYLFNILNMLHIYSKSVWTFHDKI